MSVWIIVKNAELQDLWPPHYKFTVDDSCHLTHTARAVDMKLSYASHMAASAALKRIREINPSGYYGLRLVEDEARHP